MSETPQLGERVRALADELREHVEGGRVAEAGEVADTLLGLDDEALRAGDPAVVKELLDAGSALIPAGDLARAEELYVKGLEALTLSPNATEVDLVVPLHNLFALYDQAGKPAARDYAAATLGGLAERLDEPLPTKVVAVFQQFGEMFAAQGNTVASTVFFRQVQRALSAAGNLAEAALESEAEAAEARLAASPGAEAVQIAAKAFANLGLLRLGGGRAAEAIAPLRRAAELSQDETGPRRAGSVSDLATAYFESGDLEAASREYTRAIELRLAQA